MKSKIFAIVWVLLAFLATVGLTQPKTEKATFAAGCFWSTQKSFDHLPGVISATAGYTGGKEVNPTYAQVSSSQTGHAEAVEVVFDPSKITYEKILEAYWRQINPTTPDQQFVDHGHQYRTAIFYHNEEQKKLAMQSKKALEDAKRYDKPIVTEITPAMPFYPAEEYHQKYYQKNPLRYELYRNGSGRDAYLKKIWGKEYPHSQLSNK